MSLRYVDTKGDVLVFFRDEDDRIEFGIVTHEIMLSASADQLLSLVKYMRGDFDFCDFSWWNFYIHPPTGIISFAYVPHGRKNPFTFTYVFNSVDFESMANQIEQYVEETRRRHDE